ncbi:ABC transporter permease [Nocardioides jiangxiensis]|uniref:ABC transporter permease n=1 Tax=Nocardioides jiangxiensis TaxID=3064524 RepID=A0ABT9AYV7_9ACTN|nr:ABC transporter permease [Nocardioides sp. WY-20]MDO7867533.1 ABC transporter permease [Nocardioides sp. WY-20]
MSATTRTTVLSEATRGRRVLGLSPLMWVLIVSGLVVVPFVRLVTDSAPLTATTTFTAAILSTCPIALAALGGVWSERAGIVNIGLEGQMLLGTWGAAYFNWYYGPWAGLAGGIALGVVGGLLHAVATITFGVDQIVSGVAVNIIAAGAVEFLSKTFFSDITPNGGPRNLSGLYDLPTLNIGGLDGWLSDLNARHWFLLSDLAGLLGALVSHISYVSLMVIGLAVLSWWLLRRTTFGLRLRSCGENPAAAESLGVSVYRYKYIAVMVSGGLAGLGGAYLSTVASSTFTVGQTQGRGYIGLAAMIFGNWNPFGALGASALFGYADALRLRSASSLHALLLLLAIGLVLLTLWRLWQRNIRGAVTNGVIGVAFLLWFLLTDTIPDDLGGMTPYLVTLLVLSVASQSLRMPAADGQPYRKGSAG